jgi:hypothetical protein
VVAVAAAKLARTGGGTIMNIVFLSTAATAEDGPVVSASPGRRPGGWVPVPVARRGGLGFSLGKKTQLWKRSFSPPLNLPTMFTRTDDKLEKEILRSMLIMETHTHAHSTVGRSDKAGTLSVCV